VGVLIAAGASAVVVVMAGSSWRSVNNIFIVIDFDVEAVVVVVVVVVVVAVVAWLRINTARGCPINKPATKLTLLLDRKRRAAWAWTKRDGKALEQKPADEMIEQEPGENPRA